jgi:hypothetical protein
MTTLVETARTVRSKNAGPFWVTVDIFFNDSAAFQRVSQLLNSESVATVLQVPVVELKRFDLADIYVIKFSFPRSVVQGSRFDRDMHGAQYANLVAAIEVPAEVL